MTDPARPVRVAIIGAGSIAEAAHMPAIRDQGGQAHVVAVVDVDAERSRSFAQQDAQLREAAPQQRRHGGR